jgi:hypothetical protein
MRTLDEFSSPTKERRASFCRKQTFRPATSAWLGRELIRCYLSTYTRANLCPNAIGDGARVADHFRNMRNSGRARALRFSIFFAISMGSSPSECSRFQAGNQVARKFGKNSCV